jgi:hypothetical protein
MKTVSSLQSIKTKGPGNGSVEETVFSTCIELNNDNLNNNADNYNNKNNSEKSFLRKT